MPRPARGFTLLEMMIVIAIIGIVAAVGLPSFRYLTSTNRVKSASTELYLALIRARNEAVKRNRPVSLSKNPAGWQAGWRIIADGNSDGSFTTSDPDRLVAETGEQKRVTITSVDDSIVFLASGRVQSGAPQIEVTSQENTALQRCISADLTGKPYTKEGGC